MESRHPACPAVVQRILHGGAALVLSLAVTAPLLAAPAPRLMEPLGRGVVAMPVDDDKVFVSWRLLGTEPQDIGFNVYRQSGGGEPTKLNEQPITESTNFVDEGADLSKDVTYSVRAVVDGKEQEAGKAHTVEAGTKANGYLSIPLEGLPTHYVHLAWVGDLTGDGEYDYVVDRLPTEDTQDKRQYLDAYASDGTFLWRVDFGPRSINESGSRWNSPPAVISNGHNDGVTVYDLDSDGRSEVIIKSAQGVTFGDGKAVEEGDDLQQFISVLDGRTGAEVARSPIPNPFPDYGPVAGHMGIMYLDGVHPGIVFKAKNRIPDGPFNLVVSAWDFRDGELTPKWTYAPSEAPANFHQIRIVDVDGDGRDELADGGYVLDDDGSVLYVLEGVVHGDRFHIGDLDPDREGLEGFGVQQNNPSKLHLYYYDANTGEILRTHFGDEPADIGRGTAGDIDPRHHGYEYWAFSGIYNAPTGEKLADEPNRPWPNFRIWWDGDVLSENLNREIVEKWNPQTQETERLLTASRQGAVDSWRDAAPFYGDIIGDWREEVLFEKEDHSELMIFTTTIPTDVRLYTLPHNPTYRAGMTVKGYMQSHMIDYYLGEGMETPPAPNITTAGQTPTQN